MSYQKIPLLAGVPHLLDIAGKLLLIDSPGDAGVVDIALVNKGTPGAYMTERQAGFRHIAPFDGVVLRSPVATIVTLFLSFEDVNLGTNRIEITNPGARPVPVTFSQQIVPLGSVTVNNPNDQAAIVQQQALSVIADHTAAVINAGPAQLLINDPTFKRLRIRNASSMAVVSLGGAAMTAANAAIILLPGDSWIEDDAAGAAWYAVSDTAGTDVRVMGLK
jgi:hypothetical protein